MTFFRQTILGTGISIPSRWTKWSCPDDRFGLRNQLINALVYRTVNVFLNSFPLQFGASSAQSLFYRVISHGHNGRISGLEVNGMAYNGEIMVGLGMFN